MRERLITLLLDRALPDSRPTEDFFSAGPLSVSRQQVDRRRHETLLAELRGRGRRLRSTVTV
jgi:hypothetical protein